MIGYNLTLNQKNFIHGVNYAGYQFFNCVQNLNGIWFTFLTEQDKLIVAATEFNWLLECEQTEYIPPIIINPF